MTAKARSTNFIFFASEILSGNNKASINDFEVDFDSLLVVLDVDIEAMSVQSGFGKQQVFSGETAFVDVAFSAASDAPSKSFNVGSIDFVTDSYFDSLENFLGLDIV